MRTPARARSAFALILGILSLVRLEAVVVFGRGGSTRNASAPGGALANSGWQFTGHFNAFCGVPVGRSSFLTAAHVGGKVGDRFEWRGRSYRTVGSETDSASDLRLWHVSGEFAETAIVAGQDLTVGDAVVLLGRGAERGEPILADQGDDGPVAVGWRWGELDGRLRWGTNTIAQRIDGTRIGLYGPLAGCTFDGGVGDDEACISLGDSGGPMFVRRGQEWQLAAIHFAVEAAFNTVPTGGGSNGSLFDYRGLYRRSNSGWELEPTEGRSPVPASFFSTCVAPRRAWLTSAIARAPLPPTLEQSPVPEGPFTPSVASVHDPQSRTFTVTASSGSTFFRLIGTAGLVILRVQIESGQAVIEYD
jgi:hypothetical protein